MLTRSHKWSLFPVSQCCSFLHSGPSRVHRLKSAEEASGQGAVVGSLLLPLLLRLFGRTVLRGGTGENSCGFERGQGQAQRGHHSSAVFCPRYRGSSQTFRATELGALGRRLEGFRLHLLRRRLNQPLQLRLDQAEEWFVTQATGRRQKIYCNKKSKENSLSCYIHQ